MKLIQRLVSAFTKSAPTSSVASADDFDLTVFKYKPGKRPQLQDFVEVLIHSTIINETFANGKDPVLEAMANIHQSSVMLLIAEIVALRQELGQPTTVSKTKMQKYTDDMHLRTYIAAQESAAVQQVLTKSTHTNAVKDTTKKGLN